MKWDRINSSNERGITMKRRILRHLFYVIAISCVGLIILTSCPSYRTFNLKVDIARDKTIFLSRAAESVEVAPFCQFSKYEITLYLVKK